MQAGNSDLCKTKLKAALNHPKSMPVSFDISGDMLYNKLTDSK